MVTTDKITVNKGDKVWRIDYGEVAEGVVYQSDDSWTTVQWISESNYHASFEPFNHQYSEISEELFGSEANAINALINSTVEGINEAQLLVEKLQNRVKEINNGTI